VTKIDAVPFKDGSAASVASRLVSELAEGLPNGIVPASLFGNEEIYNTELRKIFGRCWVFLAHESEIPAKGDYVQRKIGEDAFIVVRGSDDLVRVFFNACRHRGVQVCRADAGNASGFTCPYHGWAYDNKGKLLGGPLWKSAFGNMPKEENSLISPAQVDQLHGLVFATLDASAPPLLEYLGGMKWYLDLIFGLNEHGVEILGPPQRFVIPANWKSAAENFAGDDYHLGMLHRSVWDIGVYPVPFEANMMGHHIQASAGHSLSFSMAPDGDDSRPHFFAYPDDIAATFNTSRITAEQLDIARRSRVIVGNVFPNFSILALPTTYDGSKFPPTGVMTIRVWQPIGPGEVEVWNWFCGYRNMTPEQKQQAYKSGLYTFSMGGVFEMDDTDPWSSTTRNGQSVAAELLDFKLNYQMGLPGIGIATRTENWPGPGVVYSPRYDEGVQRNLLSFYAKMMSAQLGMWPSFAVE
jgi:phenylpropionate dioxygenase-like ring-hydroxylating dioxygenase large terminal subunit